MMTGAKPGGGAEPVCQAGADQQVAVTVRTGAQLDRQRDVQDGARTVDGRIQGAEQDDRQRDGLGGQRLEPDGQLLQRVAVGGGATGGAHSQPGDHGGGYDEAGRVDRDTDDRAAGQQQQAADARPYDNHEILQRGEDGVRGGKILLADDLGSQRARGGPVGRQHRGRQGREDQNEANRSVNRDHDCHPRHQHRAGHRRGDEDGNALVAVRDHAAVAGEQQAGSPAADSQGRQPLRGMGAVEYVHRDHDQV
jgi:hypothetical protein